MSEKYSLLTVDGLTNWSEEFKGDLNTQLAASVLNNFNIDEALIDRAAYLKSYSNTFNNLIETEGAPITNQKVSGRCWLFASCNMLRPDIMKEYNLKEFQLSQSYLFFYDKLEKANFFLEQIIDTHKEDLDSRLVQHLLTDPVGDGGQFDMFINIIEKYGIIPETLYPDSNSSTASRPLNRIITTKLREFAQVLREALEQNKSIDELKVAMQREIYRLLVIHLGQPPAVNESFVWEFQDKDKKYSKVETTPLKFYKDIIKKDLSKYVSLLNDPRNEYGKLIKIDRLGNVHGGKTVDYLNLPVEVLQKYAIARIQNNQPVFFGTHTPMYTDNKRGVMDESLFNFKLINYEAKQDKSSRIKYHQSLMTHAMCLTGVHLDDDGKPVRWRVENSWGKERGNDGYYIMTDAYFQEYVYQIVADVDDIDEYAKILEDDSPVVLPPWDPMGALANFE